MDKAKQAVSGFLNKAGHHDTTVHESVAPAVTNETVTPTKHENLTTAVDKEVHQDHYHTSVQPVHHREVLPEQHHHNLAAVEHREHHHGNKEDVTQKLQHEKAQFKDQSVRTESRHTQAAAPTVTGEHVHHHVHENIQPVVHKQTVEPHVTHTTVPIHEVHHNAAQHHTTSALPAVNMADFKKQGGSLTGREERYDGFEGEPRSIGKAYGTEHGHHHDHQHGAGAAGVGIGQERGSGLGQQTGSGLGHNSGSGLGQTSGSGLGHNGNSANTSGLRDSGVGGTDSQPKKAGLMAKLNPKVDADGDGKAGFMK
jgi:hypothetical protein